MRNESPNIKPVNFGVFRHNGLSTCSIFRHVREKSLGNRQWIRGNITRDGRLLDVKVSQPDKLKERLAQRLNGECIDLSDLEWDSFEPAGF